MEDTTRKKRAINFDLHGKSLKKYYSQTNPNGAYQEIGRFLHEQGFVHRQGSGYVSKSGLKNSAIV